MSALASELARLIWWYMLWLMRRPWMKALQKRWLTWVRESKRDSARIAVRRQNRWARKWGLPLITISVNLLLASVLLTMVYLLAINLYESGAFTVPAEKQRAGVRG
jgi:hypothetical protein